ncbi:MAG: electron transport complex subunit RsxE [Candidatus Eisenbacteria bacterium]
MSANHPGAVGLTADAAEAPAAAAATPGQGEAFGYLIRGLWAENPVFRGLLGMCPTLAVTAALKPALTMGLSVVFVLICSNLMVSLMRRALTPHLRILMFTLTIAVFVTIADLFLRAFVPDMSEILGPYVPLIIVNCIIIARAEACASKKGPLTSILDGLGSGLGFTVAVMMLAAVRELLADGAWFGVRILPDWWVPWTIMKLPAGAFFTLGFMLAAIIYSAGRKQAKAAAAQARQEGRTG